MSEDTSNGVRTPPQSTALTVRAKAQSVKAYIQSNLAAVKDALPRIGLTPEAVTRTALSQIYKTPALLDCDRGSLMKSIVEAASLGLSFNLGRAWLVPFRNKKKNRTEAQLIPGYQGLADIARRSGEIKSINAQAVYDGDKFEYEFGLESDVLEHKPLAEPDPAKLINVYAIVRFKDGGYQVIVLTRKQVEGVRKRSKAADSGPWVTDYEQMAIKTAVKRVLKLCPASVEMARAIELDNAAENAEPQSLAAEIFTEEEDVIDITPGDSAGEETPQSKTATVAEALKKTRKTAEKAVVAEAGGEAPQPGSEYDQQWVNTATAIESACKTKAIADIEVSAATGGKYQSRESIAGAPIDVLKAVEKHMAGLLINGGK